MQTTRGEIAEVGTGGTEKPDDLPGVLPDAVRSQVEQMLADPLFHKSERYSNLLRFIVDRTLKGQNQDLKERIIGIEVFGRSPDYDTSLDPTVRVAAGELRKRIAKYYAKAEHDQELRIEVPVHKYVAEFKPGKPIVDAPQASVKRSGSRQRYVWGSLAAAAVALAVWGGIRLFTPAPVIDRFWAPILKGSGPVLLCISSAGPESSGPPEATPSTGTGGQPGASGQGASQDVNVSVGMTDVNAINKISVYLRHKNKDLVVRAAQGISLADLRAGPSVLYGSYHNAWSKLLEGNLRYQFREDGDPGLRWIGDASNPANRDWSVNSSAAYDQVNFDYALVTRAQDPNTGQWWIGIGGLSGHGTIAINQFLLDPASMSGLAASLPRGWDKKNLQIVLAINVIQGSAGAARVVGTYSW